MVRKGAGSIFCQYSHKIQPSPCFKDKKSQAEGTAIYFPSKTSAEGLLWVARSCFPPKNGDSSNHEACDLALFQYLNNWGFFFTCCRILSPQKDTTELRKAPRKQLWVMAGSS